MTSGLPAATAALVAGEVVHPAVRGEATRALGDALAEVHWFYGRPA